MNQGSKQSIRNLPKVIKPINSTGRIQAHFWLQAFAEASLQAQWSCTSLWCKSLILEPPYIWVRTPLLLLISCVISRARRSVCVCVWETGQYSTLHLFQRCWHIALRYMSLPSWGTLTHFTGTGSHANVWAEAHDPPQKNRKDSSVIFLQQALRNS